MADQPQQAPITDPDDVPEVVCEGQFHVLMAGTMAQFTFTHARHDPDLLFSGDLSKPSSVVRARIVMSRANAIALRDLLIQLTRDEDAARTASTSGSAGPTRH